MRLKITSILAVVLIAWLCFGFAHKLETKMCEYCKGKIFYHAVKVAGFSNRYIQEYEQDDEGKFLHVWCNKILKEK